MLERLLCLQQNGHQYLKQKIFYNCKKFPLEFVRDVQEFHF
jgi:hypothetical protein